MATNHIIYEISFMGIDERGQSGLAEFPDEINILNISTDFGLILD